MFKLKLQTQNDCSTIGTYNVPLAYTLKSNDGFRQLADLVHLSE